MSKYHENTDVLLTHVIRDYEEANFSRFHPKPGFYEDIGINRIRFAKLFKGQLDMFVWEAIALADFFGVSVERFFPTKAQLSTVHRQLSTV